MGLFKKIAKLPLKVIGETTKPARKAIKHLPEPVKKSLPMLGSLAGGYFGGPMGASLGGALGGYLSGDNHRLDHALGGAAMGLGHGMFTPMLGQAMGLDPGSIMGKAAMMGQPSIGQSLGFGNIGGSAGRGAAMSGLQGLGGGGSGGILGGLGNLLGGGSGGGNGGLLNAALLATSLGGSLRAKKKIKPQQNETLDEAIRRSKRPSSESIFIEPKERNEPQFPPEGYKGLNWNYFPTPEQQEEQLRRVNEELANIPRYARGGQVKGYYKGKNGGQSDKRLVKLPEKSHILDATTVSLAGDGNSEKGAKVARDWVDSFQGSHFVNPGKNKVMRAFVSDGEFKIMPNEVAAIGSGSIDKGDKIINSMKKELRKHKGVKNFLPPQSKSLDKYAGIKR